ncbi:hypothetical protein niasHT_013444 [Heterodera trifolii]|uniref:protein xylosyltransferase n=1 Tax=Heterodera trifolii TaxID=157864 RepID=A0ABD2LCP2_9BILA
MRAVHFLPLSLLLLTVAFILLFLDRKFSKEFRDFHGEIWHYEDGTTDRLAKSAQNRIQSTACKIQLRNFLHEIAFKRHWPVKEVAKNCDDLFEVPSAANALKFRPFSPGTSHVKILFLLQLNGRDSRQLRRLFRSLFLPRHFYFVHVDSRQEFMLKEMLKVEESLRAEGFANFRVAKRRMATIWGGSNLLDLFLWTVAETLGETNSKWAQWDYIVNLSETDMPILSVEELEQNLAENRGFSFLKSHGQNTSAFLQKQGLHFHFMQCEQRMWRVAERRNLPVNLRLDGGSDWVVVHRDLALFAISDSLLPSQMRLFFSSVLLPLETFFHTLALNSANFCRRIVRRNLRFTNWRRRQGCRCAPLKSVVDWCGCSPLAVSANELGKLSLNHSQSKFHFFGRKFDSAVDISPIAFVERQNLRFRADLLPSQSAVFSAHWLNLFSALSPSDVPFGLNAELLTLFTSSIAHFMPSNNFVFQRLHDFHIYREFSAAPPQTIATFSVAFGHTNYLIEALIGQKRDSFATSSPTDFEVIDEGIRFLFNAEEGIEIGLDFDHKEEIFRTFPPLLSPSSKFTLKWRWVRLGIAADGRAKRTSPPAELLFRGPNGTVFHKMSVPSYNSFYGTQFAQFEFGRFSGVSPGVWSVALHANNSLPTLPMIASLSFPVFPDPSLSSEWTEQRIVRLIDEFFTVRDFCSVTEHLATQKKHLLLGEPISDFANCSELPWSTFFFDEKSVFPPFGRWAAENAFISQH